MNKKLILEEEELETEIEEPELEQPIKEPTEEPTEEQIHLGSFTVIQNLLSDALSRYTDLEQIVLNKDSYELSEEITNIINSIANDTASHIGMLNKALSLINPEVQEQIDNGKDIADDVANAELIESLELDESAKTDFIDKFGQDTFTNFEKAKQRLVNAGKSTDYGQYLKLSKEEVDSLIQSLYTKEKDAQKLRQLKGTDKEIRGKYNYLGEKNGFKVYQPLDYISSMDLGVNTGWCTTGRYGHSGHPDYAPSEKDAQRHFDEYTKGHGVKLYYFLNPDTMYGEYAIALYPNMRVQDRVVDNFYINESNVELYNVDDELDYESLDKLPTDLIPEEIIFNTKTFDENGLLIDEQGLLLKATEIDEDPMREVIIPDNVKVIGNQAFQYVDNIKKVVLPKSLEGIGREAFNACYELKEIEFTGNNLSYIDSYAFCDTKLTKIEIPKSNINLFIGAGAFRDCEDLKEATLPVGVDILRANLFRGCSSLEKINIPEGVTDIEANVFYHCGSLKDVTIPDSVEMIGSNVFGGCPSDLVIHTNNQYVIDFIRNNEYYKDLKIVPVE